MSRALRALSLGLALLFLLPLTGCRLVTVTVLLWGFDSSPIEGLRFWRQEAGEFVLDGWLKFDKTEDMNAAEVLYYAHMNSEDQDALQLVARLERLGSNPDLVILQLAYPLMQPGLFRVSAFNAAGDSPMSLNALALGHSRSSTVSAAHRQ